MSDSFRVNQRLWCGLIMALLTIGPVQALADIQAKTADGKTVLLKDDHSWEYVEVSADAIADHAVLRVARVSKRPKGCDIGLKLENNLGDYIRSIVPRFSAYLDNQVMFDSKSVGFSSLKPTRSQYQELKFRGVECADIRYIEVSGADRCEVGDLNKFSVAKGACLGLITIPESNLIKIHKQVVIEEPVLEEDMPATDMDMPLTDEGLLPMDDF